MNENIKHLENGDFEVEKDSKKCIENDIKIASNNILEGNVIVNHYLNNLEQVANLPDYKKLNEVAHRDKENPNFKKFCEKKYNEGKFGIDEIYFFNPTKGKK